MARHFPTRFGRYRVLEDGRVIDENTTTADAITPQLFDDLAVEEPVLAGSEFDSAPEADSGDFDFQIEE